MEQIVPFATPADRAAAAFDVYRKARLRFGFNAARDEFDRFERLYDRLERTSGAANDTNGPNAAA